MSKWKVWVRSIAAAFGLVLGVSSCGFPASSSPLDGVPSPVDGGTDGRVVDAPPPGPTRSRDKLIALWEFDDAADAMLARDTGPAMTANLSLFGTVAAGSWLFAASSLAVPGGDLAAVSGYVTNGTCRGGAGITAEVWLNAITNTDWGRVIRVRGKNDTTAANDSEVLSFAVKKDSATKLSLHWMVADSRNRTPIWQQIDHADGLHQWVVRFNGVRVDTFRDGVKIAVASQDAGDIASARFPTEGRFELFGDRNNNDNANELAASMALAAWYCRPLSDAEIGLHFSLGPNAK